MECCAVCVVLFGSCTRYSKYIKYTHEVPAPASANLSPPAANASSFRSLPSLAQAKKYLVHLCWSNSKQFASLFSISGYCSLLLSTFPLFSVLVSRSYPITLHLRLPSFIKDRHFDLHLSNWIFVQLETFEAPSRHHIVKTVQARSPMSTL